MRNDEPSATSAGAGVSIRELCIKGVNQGPLRSYGPESHPGQEEFERVMKTLRRAEPDALEPPTPAPTFPLKSYTGPIEVAPAQSHDK